MGFIGPLLSVAGQLIGAWAKRRAARAEARVRIDAAKAEAEIKRWEALAAAEADWDTEALRQSQFSWKDEWFVALLSAPFVGSFIPGLQDRVLKGWEYIALAPAWYQWSFLGAVCAAFGLRWLFRLWMPGGSAAVPKIPMHAPPTSQIGRSG